MKKETGICAVCGEEFPVDELVGVSAIECIASIHGGNHEQAAFGKYDAKSKFCPSCRHRAAMSLGRYVSER